MNPKQNVELLQLSVEINQTNENLQNLETIRSLLYNLDMVNPAIPPTRSAATLLNNIIDADHTKLMVGNCGYSSQCFQQFAFPEPYNRLNNINTEKESLRYREQVALRVQCTPQMTAKHDQILCLIENFERMVNMPRTKITSLVSQLNADISTELEILANTHICNSCGFLVITSNRKFKCNGPEHPEHDDCNLTSNWKCCFKCEPCKHK